MGHCYWSIWIPSSKLERTSATALADSEALPVLYVYLNILWIIVYNYKYKILFYCIIFFFHFSSFSLYRVRLLMAIHRLSLFSTSAFSKFDFFISSFTHTLHLFFGLLAPSSQLPRMFYHSLIHGLDFFFYTPRLVNQRALRASSFM